MENLTKVPADNIIKYLPINDIMSLKMVNEHWRDMVNEYVRINELVISSVDCLPFERIWFYTCVLISLKNLLKYDLFDNVHLNLNQPIFSRLKQLYIRRLTDLSWMPEIDGLFWKLAQLL